MCGTCSARTTPIPSQRARVSSVGKIPSFSFSQVDMYALGHVVTLPFGACCNTLTVEEIGRILG